MITSETSIQELYEVATKTIVDLQPNERFLVKELFKGFEWNRIPKNYRTKLGMLFYEYSKKEGADVIEPLGKTPQNQQIYIKLN